MNKNIEKYNEHTIIYGEYAFLNIRWCYDVLDELIDLVADMYDCDGNKQRVIITRKWFKEFKARMKECDKSQYYKGVSYDNLQYHIAYASTNKIEDIDFY